MFGPPGKNSKWFGSWSMVGNYGLGDGISEIKWKFYWLCLKSQGNGVKTKPSIQRGYPSCCWSLSNKSEWLSWWLDDWWLRDHLRWLCMLFLGGTCDLLPQRSPIVSGISALHLLVWIHVRHVWPETLRSFLFHASWACCRIWTCHMFSVAASWFWCVRATHMLLHTNSPLIMSTQ